MNITGLFCSRVSLQLRVPSIDATGAKETVTNFLLRLTTTRGLEGWGIAAPEPAITGENPDSIEGLVHGPITELVQGKDPLAIPQLIQTLTSHKELRQFPSLLAAFDMALYDLLGKVAGLPLYRLLGFFQERILTSVTLPILPAAEVLELAREYLGGGFKVLKIKLGRPSPDQDLEVVCKVYEVAHPQASLRLDANGSFTSAQAIAFLEGLNKKGIQIEFLEQPCAASSLSANLEVTRAARVPIMLDESAMDASSVAEIGNARAADYLNLKLMKNGGIYLVRELAAIAGAFNMPLMVGCMDESLLSITAALHFVLSSPQVQFADLDGHLELKEDVVKSGARLKDGYLYPPEAPGLGVELV